MDDRSNSDVLVRNTSNLAQRGVGGCGDAHISSFVRWVAAGMKVLLEERLGKIDIVWQSGFQCCKDSRGKPGSLSCELRLPILLLNECIIRCFFIREDDRKFPRCNFTMEHVSVHPEDEAPLSGVPPELGTLRTLEA